MVVNFRNICFLRKHQNIQLSADMTMRYPPYFVAPLTRLDLRQMQTKTVFRRPSFAQNELENSPNGGGGGQLRHV